MIKKAVSPLIASLLLTVFCIALSAIVLGWFSPIANNNIERADEIDISKSKCLSAGADIYSVSIMFPNETKISIYNSGSSVLNLTGATIYGKDHTSCELYFDNPLLEVGGIASATNTSCSAFTKCDEFLLVDVKSECRETIIRFSGTLEDVTGGCKNR